MPSPGWWSPKSLPIAASCWQLSGLALFLHARQCLRLNCEKNPLPAFKKVKTKQNKTNTKGLQKVRRLALAFGLGLRVNSGRGAPVREGEGRKLPN